MRLYFFFVAPALTPARTHALNVFPSTWQSPVALLVVGIIDKERIGNSPLMTRNPFVAKSSDSSISTETS